MKHWKSLASIMSFSLVLSSCAGDMKRANYDLEQKYYMSIDKMGRCSKNDDISRYVADEENNISGNFAVEIDEIHELNYKPDGAIITVLFYFNQIDRADYTHVVLAFENDKLLCWGYPDELLKSADEKIRLIGDECADIIINDIL